MRKLSIFLAAAAFVMAAASCQKTGEVKPAPSTDGSVFTATIDGGLDTRTVLTAENKVNWEEVDSISINGVVYVAAPGSDATTAIFSKNDSKEHPSAPFYAFYPVGIQTGPAAAGVLPAEQKYVAGKITNLPMFAESTTNDLTFKNICAVLAITVDSEEFSSVKSIRLSSSNKALSGAFTVENGKLLLTDSTTVANTVILSADEAVVIPQGDSTVFYIAIPAQTYEKLKIEISADGSDYSKSMRTKRGVKIVTAANTIYPVSFKEQTDPVFYATIGAITKTTIDIESGKVSWEIGDTITITDNEAVSVKYTASEIDAQGEATFTKASEEKEILGDGPYTAVYGTAPAGQQTYSATVPALPMSASSETEELTFSVSCGLMELRLKAGESIKSIVVTGTPTGESETTYIISCTEPVSIVSDTTSFYLALPAGTYSQYMLYGQNGAMCKLNSSSTISKNSITPVSFEGDLHFAVKLWAGGPFWATTNVGATTPLDYGKFFAWGYTAGQTPSGQSFSTSFNDTNFPFRSQDAFQDAATANWGSVWSVPVWSDMDNLLNSSYTTVEVVTGGIRITGKTVGYTSNSIFLPFAGCGDCANYYNAGLRCYYWSKGQYDNGNAYYLYHDNDGTRLTTSSKCCGYSIRPVRYSL